MSGAVVDPELLQSLNDAAAGAPASPAPVSPPAPPPPPPSNGPPVPVPVTDPALLQSLEGPSGGSPQAASPSGAPVPVTDPNEINYLEKRSASSAVPSDAVPGPNGLSWNKNGGYDPDTGELVIAGKPWTEAQPSAGVALSNSAVSGVPVIGPYLERGVQDAVAGIRSLTSGGSFDQNLDQAKSLIDSSNSAYPKTSTAGDVAGAVAGTLPLAETELGARALGLSGGLPERIIQGAAGGGAIGAADSAARGNSPEAGAGAGAVLGAASPIAGKAIGAVAEAGFNALPTGLTGPLANLGATAKNMLTNAVQGETPQTVAAAHQALGPSGFVGDLNNPLASLTKSIADQPETAAGNIRQAYAARSASDGDRINSAITAALGPQQDLASLTRDETAARSAAADPLYAAWRNTQVPPTDELNALMPRLNAAGVSGSAYNKMGIQGEPGYQNWFTKDADGNMTLDTSKSPTAQTWDYMKRGIDSKISAAQSSGDADTVRMLTGLKSDLVGAIDNHPDPNVAGVWQQARQAWSDPTSIMNAREAGKTALSRNTDADELRQQFQGYSPPEQSAFIQGVRGNVGQIFGATKNGDTLVKNQLLAPNSQAKLSFLVGPEKAQNLATALNQEDALASKANRITGGSPTHQNQQGSVLSGPSAIPGAVANYARNFALDRPATWLGMSPASMISQGEAQAMAKARSQLAPILTTPNGPNAELANALLNMSSQSGARQAAAGHLGDIASMLINGPGSEEARRYLSPNSLGQLLIGAP